MTKIILTILLGASSALFAQQTKESNLQEVRGAFVVKEVEGKVFYWSNYYGSWFRCKKDQLLVPDALIQMSARSAFTVVGRSIESTDYIPKELSFKSNHPMIMRLNQESLKRVELTGYYADLSDYLAEEAQPKRKKNPKSKISSAWNVVLPYFSSVQEKLKSASEIIFGGESAGQQPDKKLSENPKGGSQPMEVTSPRSGDTFVVADVPTTVAIKWQIPSKLKDREFYVFLWKARGLQGKPVATLEGSFVTLNIQQSGRYYVRVESTNAKYKSSPHIFSVYTLDDKELIDSR